MNATKLLTCMATTLMALTACSGPVVSPPTEIADPSQTAVSLPSVTSPAVASPTISSSSAMVTPPSLKLQVDATPNVGAACATLGVDQKVEAIFGPSRLGKTSYADQSMTSCVYTSAQTAEGAFPAIVVGRTKSSSAKFEEALIQLPGASSVSIGSRAAWYEMHSNPQRQSRQVLLVLDGDQMLSVSGYFDAGTVPGAEFSQGRYAEVAESMLGL